MAQSNSNSTLVLEKKRSVTSEPNEDVRIVTTDEIEEAAQCLSDAFAVDDVARYFFDTDDMTACTEEYKYELHCNIFRYLTAAHCYKGVVTTIGPKYNAVALWLAPGQSTDDWWTFFRSGMWRLYYQLSPEGRKRFFDEFWHLLHDTKRAVLGHRDDDSYYLVYLGSKPCSRGKGYARKLIEHMTTKADLERRATYLESSAQANVPYYKRYGFVHKLDIQLERSLKPVKLHVMVREPVDITETETKGKQAVVSILAL